MQENYCFDTLAGQADCVTTLAPMFSSAMSSGDFPWLYFFIFIGTTLSYIIN